jgi:hypothetical protein
VKYLLILSVLAIASTAGATITAATTPGQSAAADAKARAAANAARKNQIETMRKASAAVKLQTEAATGAKIKAATKLNIEAEVKRRVQAAEKAARVNARIVADAPASVGPAKTMGKAGAKSGAGGALSPHHNAPAHGK